MAIGRNLSRGRVSSLTVRGREHLAALAAMVTCVLASTSLARAQGPTWTGFELALEGAPSVRAGREARVRGTAYRVRGLAELHPWSGRLRARFGWRDATRSSRPWVDVQVASDGRFVAEVPVPEGDADGGPRLEIEVGPEGEARTFEIPVRVEPGVELILRTDRRLYQEGEPVHVWALLRDGASGRPLADELVRLSVDGDAMPPTTHEVTTSASGVAHLELEVPDGAPEAEQTVTATVPGQLEASARFRVGTRTYERLFADVEVEPEPVRPGAPATVRVHLTTTSGAPVRDASVVVTVDSERTYSGHTDAQGDARIAVTAPVYMVHDTGSVSVQVELSHPAHGSARAFGSMRLAVPLALRIEAQPRHGALVPEIDDVLFVHVHDALGDPPTAPTEVRVEGPAVRGGRATATTDANGIVEIPARLPIGSASAHDGTPRTTVIVNVAGPLERTARIALPVAREADVAPTPDRPITEPGSSLRVGLARRPRVSGRPVALELLDAQDRRLAVRWVSPRASSASLDVPAGYLGLATVRARAVLDGETHEGVGASARVLVRPPDPDFVQLDPVRERWTVSETATVRLRTGSGGPRRWAAVLVRDLAAHGGERPFAERFLARRFEESLRAPSDEAGLRFVRAAMASVTTADPRPRRARPLVDALGRAAEPRADEGPTRHALRDPWPIAHELARRGVAGFTTRLEGQLAAALETGALDQVTTTTGGRRRFRDDLLADDGDAKTLGGGALTPAVLEAADPSFTYDRVATRVARARLVGLLGALAFYLDPGDEASPAARMAAREPSARWLPRMVERGILGPHDLDDPWGNRFVLRRTRNPAIVISARATELELVSPGPDGRLGTRDDVRDPFARAVPAGTPYAVASGEDALMRRLAVLSPTEETLRLLREAYQRVSAEMTEEEIGDAVAADVSEGTIGLGSLGTIGHGGGAGSGSGYGSGGLGLRGTGRGGGGTGQGTIGLGSLAGIVRERFPPTLLFRPSLVVDDSGVTEIAIPLADAVTTYLVEAIVWREDGWIWSDQTRIEVDRDVVVDAPVPPLAHRGDAIRMPVRVANRGESPRNLRVRLVGDEALGVPSTEPEAVTVPAGDAVVVPVTMTPSRVGEGSLTAVVLGDDGEPIDAIRRSMRVVEGARRVEVAPMAFARGRGTIELTVPPRADPREATVTVRAGPALFAAADHEAPWATWAPPGEGVPESTTRALIRSRRDPARLGFAIGRGWLDDRVGDARIADAIEWLTRGIDRLRQREEDAWSRAAAWALLGLAPALRGRRRRDVPALDDFLDRMRAELTSDAMGRSDDPALWAVTAAALGWTAREGDDLAPVSELARRLERNVVEVGEDRWLATERYAVRSTVLLAMVDLALDRRPAAFRLLGTVARWGSRDHLLAPDELGLARAAARRLTAGEDPERAVVVVDGAEHPVELSHGAGTVTVEALARPGAHRVLVRVGDAPVLVQARVRYGLPWDVEPSERGPFTLTLDGEVGGLDETSELELTVRNRAPRTLRHPVVEIELPTGAELTERERERMGVRVERGGGVLTLHLPPMRPGNERSIRLPLRWGVAGRLRGLGIAARALDRPEAVTVLAPRTLAIEEVSR